MAITIPYYLSKKEMIMTKRIFKIGDTPNCVEVYIDDENDVHFEIRGYTVFVVSVIVAVILFIFTCLFPEIFKL